tara:strand:+ start:3347 stop:3568 length:222 start_codon:yes stop_codon:yes gene_type:complete
MRYDLRMNEMTKDEVLHWISNRSLYLFDLPEKFKKDKEIVLAAVQSDGDAIRYADESLQKDPDILKASGNNDI